MNINQDVDILCEYFLSHTSSSQGQSGGGVGYFLGGIFRNLLPLFREKNEPIRTPKRKLEYEFEGEEIKKKKKKNRKEKKAKKILKKARSQSKPSQSAGKTKKRRLSKKKSKKILNDIFNDVSIQLKDRK